MRPASGGVACGQQPVSSRSWQVLVENLRQSSILNHRCPFPKRLSTVTSLASSSTRNDWEDGSSHPSQWPLSDRLRSSLQRVNALELSTMDPSSVRAPIGALVRRRDSLELDVSEPLLSRVRAGEGQSAQLQGHGDARSSQNPSPGQGTWRYLVGLCAVSVVICYADRSNISTAILPMAEQFGWDKAYQGVVLSSFFSGYALTQVLGGQLADKLGGKAVLAGGVALWSLFTALTPSAAALGAAPLIGARILLGVGEGVAFPSIHSLISRNVPQQSQSTAVGVVTAASYAGTALAFGVSPLIISQLGWQWVYFLFAAFALLWLPLWWPVGTSDTDPFKWLSRSASSSNNKAGAVTSTSSTDSMSASTSGAAAAASGVPVPGSPAGSDSKEARGFWALMRRREVWAICAAQYCQSWGMYGLLNWLPTFFKDFYKIEIADLAAYTLLPYIVQGGLGLLSGVIADKMLASGWGVRNVRILLQVTGMIGPAACLVLAVSPAVGASAGLASNLITIGTGLSALTLGGVSASHLDIAPRHAGVIFGAGNTAATLAGLLSVPFTGYLLQATGSWPLVFGVTAAHYVIGAALWALWVGERQLPEDLEEEGSGPPSRPAGSAA